MVMVEVVKETRASARIPKEEALTRTVKCVRRVEAPITLRPIADSRTRNAPTAKRLGISRRSAAVEVVGRGTRRGRRVAKVRLRVQGVMAPPRVVALMRLVSVSTVKPL